MSSIWKLNGHDIYVDQFSEKPQGEAAELNPLNSTSSIYHKIFESDALLNFQGTIIGTTFETGIRATLFSEITLITDLSPGGFTVFVDDVQTTRTPSMSQFVDSSQAVDAPVYRATIAVRAV